jgi:hypothetical protein
MVIIVTIRFAPNDGWVSTRGTGNMIIIVSIRF